MKYILVPRNSGKGSSRQDKIKSSSLIIKEAATRLVEQFPNIKVVGETWLALVIETDETTVQQIREANPNWAIMLDQKVHAIAS